MEPNLAVSVFTSSALSVYLIQKLKDSKYFPWLTAETAKLNRVASALLAALGAVGLQYQWTSSTHTLVITNLTLSVIGLGIWHWLQHFTLQEVVYRATTSNSSLAKLIEGFLASQKPAAK